MPSGTPRSALIKDASGAHYANHLTISHCHDAILTYMLLLPPFIHAAVLCIHSPSRKRSRPLKVPLQQWLKIVLSLLVLWNKHHHRHHRHHRQLLLPPPPPPPCRHLLQSIHQILLPLPLPSLLLSMTELMGLMGLMEQWRVDDLGEPPPSTTRSRLVW